jgi:hypothetical protein
MESNEPKNEYTSLQDEELASRKRSHERLQVTRPLFPQSTDDDSALHAATQDAASQHAGDTFEQQLQELSNRIDAIEQYIRQLDDFLRKQLIKIVDNQYNNLNRQLLEVDNKVSLVNKKIDSIWAWDFRDQAESPSLAREVNPTLPIGQGEIDAGSISSVVAPSVILPDCITGPPTEPGPLKAYLLEHYPNHSPQELKELEGVMNAIQQVDLMVNQPPADFLLYCKEMKGIWRELVTGSTEQFYRRIPSFLNGRDRGDIESAISLIWDKAVLELKKRGVESIDPQPEKARVDPNRQLYYQITGAVHCGYSSLDAAFGRRDRRPAHVLCRIARGDEQSGQAPTAIGDRGEERPPCGGAHARYAGRIAEGVRGAK